MNDKVGEYIEDEVYSYQQETYEFQDKLKELVFACLIAKVGYDIFLKKSKKLFDNYSKQINKKENKGFKKVKEITSQINEVTKDLLVGNKPDLEVLNGLFKKIDMSNTEKSKEVLYKRTKNFYKSTEKTLKKDWVEVKPYLSKKVSQYDKVEKVVPYFRKDGVAYYDIASYNSMVYNTNLTRTSWNSSYESAEKLEQDLVKMSSHAFACDLCREHQGKIYSLTGATKGYPLLSDVADEYGTMHPNCKHSILLRDLEEDLSLSGPEWKDRYEAKQKKQALELKRSRLKNDKKIYKELGNEEEVDKLNKKISKLNSSIKEQKELMK